MDTLEISLEIKDGNAEVVIGKNKQLLQDFIDTAAKAQPQIKFRVENESYINLDKLEKRALDTRKQFELLATTRLDGGNVGNLTKEVVRASERSRQLESDIKGIKRELLNPNRKSSIAFLTDELRAAEKEADSLNRKLSALPKADAAIAGKATGGRRSRGSNTEVTRALLEVTDDFVPAGFNRPFNAVSKELLAISTVSTATLATFGAIAAVGYGIVKVTQNIREEAERRLKYEELIVGAVNRQILGAKQALKDYQELTAEQARARAFSRDLQTASKEQLQQQLATVERLIALSPTGGNAEQLKNDGAQLRAQIEQISYDKNALLGKAFDENFQIFQKNQEKNRQYEIEAQKKSEADRKKRDEDLEKAKTKIKELEKTYLSTFDTLFQKSAANNPFVTIFTDSDKALRELKENLRRLPGELQAVAIKMQQQFNLRKLLEAGVDNKLSVYDLRESAQNFRNPFDGDKQKKEQDEFVQRFLRNNPNYLYLLNKNQLDDEERAKILKRFAPSSLNETPADRLNKSLDDKFNLLYKPGQTAEQQAIADKRFISATAGTNPLDLTRDLREKAAVVREREAIRQERYQQEAIGIYREQREYQKQIAENTKRQNDIAGRGGTKAIKLTLQNDSDAKAQLQPAATSADTDRAYFDPDFSSLNNHGTLSNR